MQTVVKARFLSAATIATIAMGVSGVLQAKDAIDPGDSDSRWVVGLGSYAASSLYAGEESESDGNFRLEYRGNRFFAKNNSLNFRLKSFDNFSVGLTLTGQGGLLTDEDEYRDNARLAGLRERDEFSEAGLYLYHTTPLGRFKLHLLDEISDEYDGQSASLSYTFDLKAGDWNINPYAGFGWMSHEKVNHLYGVSAAEATASRAAYNPDSALNYFTGVRARYEIDKHWDLNLNTGAAWFDSAVSDSPIVDDETVIFGALSVNYNF